MLWPLCTGGWSCGLRCIRNECHKWSPRLWHKNACLTTDGLVYRHWPDLQTMTLIHHWWTGPQSLTRPTNSDTRLTTDGLVHSHWPDLQTVTLGWPLMDWFTVTDLTYKQWHSADHWWTDSQLLTRPTNSDTRLTIDALVHSHWPDLQTVTLGWPLMDWSTVIDPTYKQWHSLTTDGLVHSHWPDLQTVTLSWPLMDWFTVTDPTYKHKNTRLTTDKLVHTRWLVYFLVNFLAPESCSYWISTTGFQQRRP